MMMKLVALVLVLFSLQAQAGIYLEPYAGYISTKYSTEASGTYLGAAFTTDDTSSDGGVAYGGKLGYSIPLLGVGFDYLKAGDFTDLGPFLEVRLPLFLKFRATYIMASKGEEEEIGFSIKGSGLKVGFAFSLFANLTANLDYVMASYDEMDGTIEGYDIDKIEVKRNAIMVGLGFPFEI